MNISITAPAVQNANPPHIRSYEPPLIGKPYELETSGTLGYFKLHRSNHGKLGGGNFDEIIAARCARFGKHNLLNDHEDVLMNLGGGRIINGMRELRHKFIDCCTYLIGLHAPLTASAVVRSGSAANDAAIKIAIEYQKRAGKHDRTFTACSALAHTSITSQNLVKRFPVNLASGEIIVSKSDLDQIAVFVVTAGETCTGMCEWVSDEILEYLDREKVPLLLEGCNGGTVNSLPDKAAGFVGDNSPLLVERMRHMMQAPAAKFISMEPGKTVGGSEAALIGVINTEKDNLLQKTAEDILHCSCSEFFHGEGQYLASTVPANTAAALYLFLDTYGIRRVQFDEFIAKRAAIELSIQLKKNGIFTLGGNLNWVTIPFPDKDSLEDARKALGQFGIAHIEKEDVKLNVQNGSAIASVHDNLNEKEENGFFALRVVIRPGELLTAKGFSLLLNSILAYAPKEEFNPLPSQMTCFNYNFLASRMEDKLKCRIGAEELQALDKFYSNPQKQLGLDSETIDTGTKGRFHKAIATLSVLTISSDIKFPVLLGDCLQFAEIWRDRTWPSKVTEERRVKWLNKLRAIEIGIESRFNFAWYCRLRPQGQILFAETLTSLIRSLNQCLKHLPLKDKQSSKSAGLYKQNLDLAIEYAIGSGVILTGEGEPFIIDRLRSELIPIPILHEL